MKPSFNKLWENYPSEQQPCKQKDGRVIHANQCAIRVGVALQGAGVNLKTFPSRRKCWEPGHTGHTLAAQELANWLGGQLGGPKKYTTRTHGDKPGEKAKADIQNKTGIIFFKDYWQRDGETSESRSGDHIDLWNRGTTKTSNDSGNMSKEVWFWELS